jgi:hypothetical protein
MKLVVEGNFKRSTTHDEFDKISIRKLKLELEIEELQLIELRIYC